MDQGERTGELYDFLYRDSNRIGSYYAQVFGGLLSTFETTRGQNKTTAKTVKGSAYVLSGEGTSSQQTQSGSKQTLNPHDIVAADVLASLMSTQRVNHDVTKAPNGSLVIAHGTLVFIDRSMLELGKTAFGMAMEVERKKPKHQRNAEAIQNADLIEGFLGKIVIPSAFLLRADGGPLVGGTIKDEGMEEPITSYYFKHGTAGLSGVHMVGIKESASLAFTVPGTQLFAAGQQAAQVLSDLLFPKSAVRVTPIALFRKLT
jgi:hypothetical protein